MKDKKIFTVTDLGGGDGGKGGVVHKVCVEMSAHTVLKVGGAQGSHGVRTSSGKSFNFSQFGCGTFEGTGTHVTNLMVIEPLGLLAEGESLRFEHGVADAFDLITVDEDCLCATPFHGIASRLRELARKEAQKGTVGVGIGEAKLDSELHPELAIYARDLKKPDLRDKIEAVRRRKLAELAPIIESVESLWPDDRDLARSEIEALFDEGFADRIADRFALMPRRVKVVGTDYLEKEVLSKDGVAVVESSHGILTDRYYGFHPFVSRLRTLPCATFELLRKRGYDGEIVKLGVTRAYQIRHGAGPMVTESSAWLDKLLPDSHKNDNRWQGRVRVGPLDLVALRYSIAVCGGPEAFDGLAITWFDQIQAIGNWPTCDKYDGADDPKFFAGSGRTIKVQYGEDDEQIRRQEMLGKLLGASKPVIEDHELVSSDDCREKAIDLCSGLLEEKLGVPVRMMSFGSTEEGKICL